MATENLRMRQFLLGELGENEREELEQRVLTEAGVRDKLLMAEDDLIEEYLEGSLKGEEGEKFLRQFLSIPHQRHKLRIAKSLRRFARDEANIKADVLSEVNDNVSIEPRRISNAERDTVAVESRMDTVRIKRERLTKPLVVPLSSQAPGVCPHRRRSFGDRHCRDSLVRNVSKKRDSKAGD